MKGFIACLVVAAAVSAVSAQGVEEAAWLSHQNFSALGTIRMPAFQKVNFAAKSAPKPAKAAAAADLEALWVGGSKPAEGDLRGWFAGRRFTNGGPTAALLVGTDVFNDPAQGPIAGKTFKLFLWAADKPLEGQPETYWDEPGSAALDAVAWNIHENAGDWSRADFTGDKSVVTRKGESAFELRRAGDWLVAKFPNGDYGYFFKKVR